MTTPGNLFCTDTYVSLQFPFAAVAQLHEYGYDETLLSNHTKTFI